MKCPEALRVKRQWQVQYGEYWWDIPEATCVEINTMRTTWIEATGREPRWFVYEYGPQRARKKNQNSETGASTTISRYEINMETMMQRNVDSGAERRVRFVYIDC